MIDNCYKHQHDVVFSWARARASYYPSNTWNSCGNLMGKWQIFRTGLLVLDVWCVKLDFARFLTSNIWTTIKFVKIKCLTTRYVWTLYSFDGIWTCISYFNDDTRTKRVTCTSKCRQYSKCLNVYLKRRITSHFIQPWYFRFIDVYNRDVPDTIHTFNRPQLQRDCYDKRFTRNQRQVCHCDWSPLINCCNYECLTVVLLTRERELIGETIMT